MTITYTIDENDYLAHHLHCASRSANVKRSRLKSKLIPPLAFLILAFFNLYKENLFLFAFFSATAILWFFLYPLREKQRYVTHYRDFVTETYKNRLSTTYTFELSEDHILTKEPSGESKIATTEIEEITEIETLVAVKLKSGNSFILPKNKIKEIDALRLELQALAKKLNVNYTINNNWKWE